MNTIRALLIPPIFLAFALTADAQLSERTNEILREGNFRNLSAEEKSKTIADMKENWGAFAADLRTYEFYLFLLGDRETHDQVIKKFREQAVQRGGSEVDVNMLASSPHIETVTAVADLLWQEKGGLDGGDVVIGSAAVETARLICGILRRSREVPPQVAVWARELYDHYDATPEIMRDWWQKNERAFREKRYKDAVPGQPAPPMENEPTSEATEAAPPAAVVGTISPVATLSKLPTPIQDHNDWLLLVACILLLGVGWIFWYWRTKSK